MTEADDKDDKDKKDKKDKKIQELEELVEKLKKALRKSNDKLSQASSCVNRMIDDQYNSIDYGRDG